MQTFGAELVGNQRTLLRTKLLQQLKKHRGRAAFRGEEERRARLAELRKARITGIRVPPPVETLNSKLASLPEEVTVERDRIEVRFSGATEALVPAAGEPAVATGGVLPQVIVDAAIGGGAVPGGSSRGGSRTRGRVRRTGGRWGNSSDGARREASGCAMSLRSTWPPTSGRTRDRSRR